MTDDTNNRKMTLTLGGRLELKRTLEGSHVRQSLSQGRSKVVQVEVRKKRLTAGDAREKERISDEQAQKLKVLMEAQKAEDEARFRAAEEKGRGNPPPSPKEGKREDRREEQPRPSVIEAPKKRRTGDDDEERPQAKAASSRKRVVEAPAAVLRPARTSDRRNTGKIDLRRVSMDSEDEEGGTPRRGRSLASIRRAREKERLRQIAASKPPEKVFREVVIPETITVGELANRMTERSPAVIKELMKLGLMATINDVIDADTAELVVTELGHKAKRVASGAVEDGLKKVDSDASRLLPRPPVVTVMGHVDHGKTSLLDVLRETSVAKGEAGGITQHIGAYQVEIDGRRVTFIDTPGHAAFTGMRARGAKVTDIVVLVVAANDGVMPQTIEAISHAKAAGVPLVVAINKIDLPGADPNRVRNDLLSQDVVVESMGGDTLEVEVSAKERRNLNKLIEAILLQADVLDMKADPDRPAEGSVIEAKIEKGRGPVATVLVHKGTLRIGDIFVAGSDWGRVRALMNERGGRLSEAGPSLPVEVLGLQSAPTAGDEFIVVDSEDKARAVASYRQQKAREVMMVKSAKDVSADSIFDKIKAGEVIGVPVIVKADVQGSVEALNGILGKLATDKVKVKVVHSAVGAINESDVMLAKASKALIAGFNVRTAGQAREQARQAGVDIRYYSVVYDVVDDLKQAMAGKLSPKLREKFIGYAEIRKVFSIPKVGKVGGAMVTEGVVKRGSGVRLLRDGVVVYEGKLKSLQRNKDEAKEVKSGFECGIKLESYDDVKELDVVECFDVEEVAEKLDVAEI